MRHNHVGQSQSGDETQGRREELLYPRKIEVEREGEEPKDGERGDHREIQRDSNPTLREHLATRLEVLTRVPTDKPHRESSERRKDDPRDEAQGSLQVFRALVSLSLERDDKREG